MLWGWATVFSPPPTGHRMLSGIQMLSPAQTLRAFLNKPPPGEASRLAEAIEWLKAKLSGGPVPSKNLLKDAKQDGVAEKTLRRAKDVLRAEASKNGSGGWDWKLPTPIPGAKP